MQSFIDRFVGYDAQSFEHGLLYRLHPKGDRYLPAHKFEVEIANEMGLEMIYLMRDVGASKIIIDKRLFEAVEHASQVKVTATATVPPFPVAQTVEAAARRENGMTYSAETHTLAEFAAPEFKPHIRVDDSDGRWYFNNNKFGNSAINLVQQFVLGKHPADVVEVSLNIGDTVRSLTSLQGEVAEFAGVGYMVEHKGHTEYDYKMRVKFFDKALLENLGQYSSVVGEQGKRVRLSLAGLAKQRLAFKDADSHVREDVKVFNDEGRPIPFQEYVKDEATWRTFLGLASRGSTLTIPIVLYGPKGAGKSSVIFSWRCFCREVPFSFLQIGDGEWHSISSTPGEHESFLKGVHFDAEGQHHGQIFFKHVDAEEYGKMSDIHQVRALMYDTRPAETYKRDVKGARLPFGMQVLVLDIVEVVNNLGTSTNADQLRKLVGEQQSATSDSPKRPGILNCYPPICTILAKSNALSDDKKVKAAIEWVKKELHQESVFVMPTLTPPSQEQAIDYARDTKARKAMHAKWNKEGVEALRVLQAVINKTAEHEVVRYSRYLECGRAAAR